jgi:hypothetical protein
VGEKGLNTFFSIYYANTFTPPSTPVYNQPRESLGFYKNTELPSINVSDPIYEKDKYIMLWGDIESEIERGSVRNRSILAEIEGEIIPASHLDKYSIIYSYKLANETAFTPITTASPFYAGNINPLMFVIDRSKFPGLKILNDKCVFRCEINYVNTSFIGSKAAIYENEVTVSELSFVTNSAGELSNIIGGNISTLEIPAYITAFSSDFRENMKGVYQGGGQYDRIQEIKTLILHKNITKIGEGAFKDIQFLTSIRGMSPSVTIQKDAFAGCRNLEEVLFDTSA